MCYNYNGQGFIHVLVLCDVSSQFLHLTSVLTVFLLFTPQLSLQLLHFDLMQTATFYIPCNPRCLLKGREQLVWDCKFQSKSETSAIVDFSLDSSFAFSAA